MNVSLPYSDCCFQSEIISFTGKKHTEVFVNVESHELQDNSRHLRSQLPMGKGAFDDKESL